jgi:hypothetical protein
MTVLMLLVVRVFNFASLLASFAAAAVVVG